MSVLSACEFYHFADRVGRFLVLFGKDGLYKVFCAERASSRYDAVAFYRLFKGEYAVKSEIFVF